MELTRTLPPAPTSPAIARRLLRDALHASGGEHVEDVATLLASELVTNAVLHAGSPINLRIRVGVSAVRVEVADASAAVPAAREHEEDASTGRGLEMVELLADAWGVDPEPPGKAVWFQVLTGTPSSEPAPHTVAGPVMLPAPAPGCVEVRLLGLPVQLYRATQQHNDALLREFALVELTQRPGLHSASRARHAIGMAAAQAQLQEAFDLGTASVDLVLHADPQAHVVSAEFLTALDHADELAGQGRLLTPPTLPEVRSCRGWVFGQVIEQLQGRAPTPWRSWTRPPTGGGAALTQIEPATILEGLGDAVLAGDEENRIAYVNPAAEQLLGWPHGELEGRRIITIIPPRLHESHLAGFTRYLATGEARLIGHPAVRVPAQRRDGTEVEVELVLTAVRGSGHRRAFVVSLRAAPSAS